MRLILTTLVLTLCLLASNSEGGKGKKGKDGKSDYTKNCIKAKPTVVDEKWLKDAGKTGLHIPMHSNCNNCKKDKGWGFLAGRSFMQEICWVTELHSKWGKFSLPFNCRYFKFEQQVCHLDASTAENKKAARKLGYSADIVLTLTDNSTFVAGANCIRGRENFWWVASTSEKLDDSKKEEIEKHFTDMGFKTDNVAKDGDWKKSPVIFKKFILKDNCPEAIR